MEEREKAILVQSVERQQEREKFMQRSLKINCFTSKRKGADRQEVRLNIKGS
jgi:hypothetical protein